jgi:hypothetical protein
MGEREGSGMNRLSALALVVDLSVPAAEDFAAAAGEWLAEIPARLAPAEWRAVLREEKPPFRGQPQAVWPDYEYYQEPFMVWARIVVAPAKWRGMKVWVRRATERNMTWLDGALAARPVSAMLSMLCVDANGNELPGGGFAAIAEAGFGGAPAGSDLAEAEIPVARLSCGDNLGWRAEPPPGGIDALAKEISALAREWAERDRVTALFVGRDVNRGGTALIRSLRSKPWEDVAQSDYLAGYAWITLCRAELSAALGGAARLAASGAFWQVEELANGSVLLQVTEKAADYGPDEARAAFEALAPVLPPGLPERNANWPDGEPWLVTPQDAEEWRAGRRR